MFDFLNNDIVHLCLVAEQWTQKLHTKLKKIIIGFQDWEIIDWDGSVMSRGKRGVRCTVRVTYRVLLSYGNSETVAKGKKRKIIENDIR